MDSKHNRLVLSFSGRNAFDSANKMKAAWGSVALPRISCKLNEFIKARAMKTTQETSKYKEINGFLLTI